MNMNDMKLRSKTIDVTMMLDGKEFRHSVTIPEGDAKSQWIRCQGLGDTIAKTVWHYSDIKDHITEQVN